jgi:hypothetical protein
MRILINEKQYQYIYNTPDRPLLTEITFVELANILDMDKSYDNVKYITSRTGSKDRIS